MGGYVVKWFYILQTTNEDLWDLLPTKDFWNPMDTIFIISAITAVCGGCLIGSAFLLLLQCAKVSIESREFVAPPPPPTRKKKKRTFLKLVKAKDSSAEEEGEAYALMEESDE